MLEEAYCLETNLIEIARYAVHKRDIQKIKDHYYCIDCGVEAYAKVSSLGTCFFRAEAGGHEAFCPNWQKPHDGDGSPSGPYSPIPPSPIIPNVLGFEHLPQNERYEFAPLEREQIRALARQAQHAPIPGTIEEVVSAYCAMPEQERLSASLSINNHSWNYYTAFSGRYTAAQNANADFWKSHIVLFNVIITAGDVAGFWFLESKTWVKLGNNEARPVKLIIRPTYVSSLEKEYLSQFLEGNKEAMLFWHGPLPTWNKRGYLLEPGNSASDSFALRVSPTN